MNTLTVNLHLLMTTFYRPTAERFRIVIEDAAFPSDSHAVASQARQHGFDPATAVVRLRPREGEAALRTEDIVAELERLARRVALVLLGGVNYLTGELVEIPADHRRGARHRRGRRLGPGARGRQRPARSQRLGRRLGRLVPLQVRQRRAGRAGGRVRRTRATRAMRRCRGWRAGGATTRRRAFAWSPSSCRARARSGWQVSTPPVLAFAPLRASLELFDAVGMPALRERSLRLTGYLESLLDVVVAERRAQIMTPREPGAARLPALALGARRAHARGAPARRARRHLRRARARRDPARAGAALLQLPRLLARGHGAARAAAGALTRARPERQGASRAWR